MEPVNRADLEWSETERERTHFRRKNLAAAAGADDLGASRYELPPGASSWPYHYHAANAAAVSVLSGTGTFPTPDGEDRVEPGERVPGVRGGRPPPPQRRRRPPPLSGTVDDAGPRRDSVPRLGEDRGVRGVGAGW